MVGAFLAASRDGDFARLVAVLAPGVVLRADELSVRTAAARPGAPALAPEVRGAAAVADAFKGRARGAQQVLIDGAPGAVWAAGGQVRAAFLFEIEDGVITGIDLVMEPELIAELDVQ